MTSYEQFGTSFIQVRMHQAPYELATPEKATLAVIAHRAVDLADAFGHLGLAAAQGDAALGLGPWGRYLHERRVRRHSGNGWCMPRRIKRTHVDGKIRFKFDYLMNEVEPGRPGYVIKTTIKAPGIVLRADMRQQWFGYCPSGKHTVSEGAPYVFQSTLTDFRTTDSMSGGTSDAGGVLLRDTLQRLQVMVSKMWPKEFTICANALEGAYGLEDQHFVPPPPPLLPGQERNGNEQPPVSSKIEAMDLSELIGMEGVQSRLEQVEAVLELARERGQKQPVNLHALLVGPPGSGKTTVARQLGRIYHEAGLLKRGHVIEISGPQILGDYLGQTKNVVKKYLDAARGGVLLIDEAYALAGSSDKGHIYAEEAAAQLLKALEEMPDIAIVFAGYEDKMEALWKLNPGLRGRIGLQFALDELTAPQLSELLIRWLEKDGYELDGPIMDVAESVERWHHDAKREDDFAGARSLLRLYESWQARHAVSWKKQKTTKDALRTIDLMECVG